MKVVLASHNPGKQKEFQAILAASNIELVLQSEFNVTAIKETGKTFVENAILKARHASQVAGLPALGDDSGLEVKALNGAPGIYSARYAGEHATTAARHQKLLEALKGVPAGKRQARFVCVLALMRHATDPTPIIAQGVCEGEILEQPRGTHGFGYDPLLYLPSLGKTCAELTPDEKNQVSHRAHALQSLLLQLKSL